MVPKTDKERYEKEIAKLEEWMERNVPFEDELTKRYTAIPNRNKAPANEFHESFSRYVAVAREVRYKGFIGKEALRVVRNNLKFLRNGVNSRKPTVEAWT